MGRWIWIAVAAAAVLLVVLYVRKAWAGYTTDPKAVITTSDPALQRELWKNATAYGESIPMDR